MARDYKRAGNRGSPPERPFGSSLSFITGLGIGLLVAVLVYFWQQQVRGPGPATSSEQEAATYEAPATEPEGSDLLDQQQSVIPKFDFYKILPEIEIKVPEEELAAPPPTPATPESSTTAELDAATYILQAGSFQRFEDADQAKAQLALQGVQASIQRVVINGQDVWHRVHIGPFRTLGEVQVTRTKLSQLGLSAIVLKLGDDER